MKVALLMDTPTTDIQLDRCRSLVLRDLDVLRRQRQVEPVLMDKGAFLASTVALRMVADGGTAHLVTMDMRRTSSPGLLVHNSVTPRGDVIGMCDLFLIYAHDTELFDKIIDAITDCDPPKEWVLRNLPKTESVERDMTMDTETPKWQHALDKAMRNVKALPNQGLQTRQIVDFRPPRNPND